MFVVWRQVLTPLKHLSRSPPLGPLIQRPLDLAKLGVDFFVGKGTLAEQAEGCEGFFGAAFCEEPSGGLDLISKTPGREEDMKLTSGTHHTPTARIDGITKNSPSGMRHDAWLWISLVPRQMTDMRSWPS